MNSLIIILGIVMGSMLIISKTFNMLLGEKVGIYGSNFANHGIGILGSGMIYLFTLMMGVENNITLQGIPWYVFMGGVLGSTFVVLSNYSFSKTSVITSTVLLLIGQFVGSLLIDRFFLYSQIEWIQIMGGAFISMGVMLYNVEFKKEDIMV